MTEPSITINHLAIVVPQVDAALGFWRDALGMTVAHTERNAAEAVEIAFLPAGGGEIELIAPLVDADGTPHDSGIARYLAKRGAGLHHVCLDVADLDAALQRLAAHDVQMINETPRLRPDGTRYVFIHPSSTGGVLVELYQTPVTGHTQEDA